MTTSIFPSPQACELYVEMALRAKSEHLSLVNTLTLAVDRVEAGRSTNTATVCELMEKGWIASADDGGWTIAHQ